MDCSHLNTVYLGKFQIMQKATSFMLLVVFFLGGCASKQNKASTSKITYPLVDTVAQVDDYHGTPISDPFRWLENDTSAETGAWVKAQNAITFDYLKQIDFRDKIKERLTKLWNYPKSYAPFKRGEYIYYFKNDGLQNQDVLYRSKDLDKNDEELFLDPNTLKDDGTAALGSFSFSEDGMYFAYAINDAGSDWQTIYVMDTKTKKTLNDKIQWAKFTGMSWKNDGFYYSHYDAPKGSELSASNENIKVSYHKVGTDQQSDELVFERKDFPKHYLFADISEDKNFLVINESKGTHGEVLHLKDLRKPNSDFVQLNTSFDHDHYMVGNIGDKVMVYTNQNAKNYKLVSLPTAATSLDKAVDFVKEDQERVLKSVDQIGKYFVLTYMKDAHNQVEVVDHQGIKIKQIDLPAPGSVWGFDGDNESKETYFSFSSYLYPLDIYKLSLDNFETTIYKRSEIAFDASKYETKQVFYKSKDGTKVPMFLTYKKGITLDGSNPTYLYGYGGFNISITPSFRVTTLPCLEN